MSGILFHTVDSTVRVRGSERAHFNYYLLGTFIESIDVRSLSYYNDDKRFYNLMMGLESMYLINDVIMDHDKGTANLRDGVNPRAFGDNLSTIFMAMDTRGDLLFGATSPFTAALNTALLIGGDVLKLAARLHAQCEIHAYVKGHNRKWLASIIKQGLEIGFYRPDAGWDEVIALLRSSNEGAVVTSYTITERFPNPHIARWRPSYNEYGELHYDDFYDLSDEEQWNLAIKNLFKESTLEMKPDNWNAYWVKPGYDAFKLNALLSLPFNTLRNVMRQYDHFISYGYHPAQAWPVALERGKLGLELEALR